MLKKKDVALLDIGSSKIDLIYGSMNDNSVDIAAHCSAQYSGFADGQFFEEDKLIDIVKNLLDQVESRVGKRIRRKIYVAVPGEFINVELKKVKEQFPKPRVVVSNDWENLIDKAEAASNDDEYVNIGSTGLAFEADSFSPLSSRNDDDVVTRSITATVSCVMCARSFINLFGNIFDNLYIKEAEYISSSFAEALYLTDKKERDKGILLCDIGYITTNIMFIKGNGIYDICSFSRGGGHIIASLMEIYGLDFKSSEDLFNKINLKIEPREGDMYRFNMPDGVAGLPMGEVNEVCTYEIDILVKYIKKCIERFGDAVGPFAQILFTGGGLMKVKGAVEHIAHAIGRQYDIRVPNVAKYNFPWCSSLMAGLDLASRSENNTSVMKKFFNKLFGG